MQDAWVQSLIRKLDSTRHNYEFACHNQDPVQPNKQIKIDFFSVVFIYFLLYNIVLVLPYINMHPPWVYTCSPFWTPLPPPSPSHPSGSSQGPSPKHPVLCIEPGLVIRFTCDIIHVSVAFSHIIPPKPRTTLMTEIKGKKENRKQLQWQSRDCSAAQQSQWGHCWAST